MTVIRHPLLFMICCFAILSARAEQKIVYNLSGEPKTLDPHLATGVLESHIINTLIDGLTLLDEKGQAKPGLADKWQAGNDGTSYTFHLRAANWSNGQPVTAHDFVYGWRRCLAPETASEYAYQLFLVQGAAAFNAGKNKDPESVGIKATSDTTLDVKLVNATPYFPSLVAHFAFAPLKESWVKTHPKWASEPSTYLSNGPFTLAEWRHNDRLIVKKNPNYYNAAKTRLDVVEMTMITNESTALLQWEAGKVDLIETSIPLPDIPRLKSEGKLGKVPYLGVYYVALQHEKKPFNDARVRRAFSLAINRKQITDAILRGGQPPALAFVPPGIELEGGGDYRAKGGDLFKEDVAEAKRLLAEAGYPNGRGLPRIRYMYNDLQMHRTLGEALQRMWLENIGAKVDLQVQEYKVYLQNLHAENYQMARAGWIGDFMDPVAFLDMFQTGAGNNDFKYSNPQFDKLVADSRSTTDPVKRTEVMRAAEKLLIADDMAVAPIYHYVNQYLQKPHLKGIVRNPTGSLYFHTAYIEQPAGGAR